jgi:hypothetical protein
MRPSTATLDFGRLTRLLGLGGTVVRWMWRGCRGPVVRRVCLPTLVGGIATDALIGAVPEIVAVVRGTTTLRRARGTVVRALIISGACAGVTAVVVTMTAGLAPPVQLVLLIACTVATAELESVLRRLLASPRFPATNAPLLAAACA